MTVRAISFPLTRGAWRGLSNQYRDNFVARFTGTLRVPRTGHYNFWTNSDDGSKLWVNGRLVVNNDGLHGMRWRHGRIHLRRGSSASIKVCVCEGEGVQ